jgi:hypothetical protein
MVMTTNQEKDVAQDRQQDGDARYFMLEEFELTDPGQQRVERTLLLSRYEALMTARLPESKRLFTSGAMSGNPSSFAQLWLFPKTYSPAQLREQIPALRQEALGAYLPASGKPTQEVLEPTAYSPGASERGVAANVTLAPLAPLDQISRMIPRLSGVAPASRRFFDQPPTRAVVSPASPAPSHVHSDPRTTPVVLIVQARVKPDQRDAFVKWKQDFFKEYVKEFGHWYLYAAGWKTTEANVAINFWALENAQDLLKIMMLLSENSIYQSKLRPTIESESQSLYWLDWDARDYFPYAHG